jgi:hypothetical protein
MLRTREWMLAQTSCPQMCITKRFTDSERFFGLDEATLSLSEGREGGAGVVVRVVWCILFFGHMFVVSSYSVSCCSGRRISVYLFRRSSGFGRFSLYEK